MERIDVELFASSSDLTKDKILECSRKYGFQVFDLDSVVSRFQLKLAYYHAINAFEEKRNITNDLMLEWLVRASGKRQIKEALNYIGLKNPNRIAIGFDRNKIKMKKEKILDLIKGKEIEWKDKDDSKIISEMVELEIEE
ncbi:MAG: KEOPS complex subunit Cgi121 [Candidatus Micrarchaeia archaeon]